MLRGDILSLPFDSIWDSAAISAPSRVQPIVFERNTVREAIANDNIVFASFLSNANLRMENTVIGEVEVDDGD